MESCATAPVTPSALLEPSIVHCDAQPPATWRLLCTEMAGVWRAHGSVVHFAVNSAGKDEREVLARVTGKGLISNAGDALLPIATRLAFRHFLGHPRWVLAHLRQTREMVASQVSMAVSDPNVAAVVVGGGGLFYPANPNSQQSFSGWQWRIDHQALARLIRARPLLLFGVGWNRFRGQADAPKIFDRAFNLSLATLTSTGTAAIAGDHAATGAHVGLRDSYSLGAIGARVRNARRIVYQPCATTLIGALQPCLATRTLLNRSARILAIGFAADQLELRIGRASELSRLLEQLLRFALNAHHDGWEIHFVEGARRDNDELMRAHSAHNWSFPYRVITFGTASSIVEYYRSVTVVASSRGHGVMIPFGLHCATISLITHEKVRSFLDDIGHPEWGVELTASRRDDGGARVASELGQLLAHIDVHRAQVHAEIVLAQRRLLQVTADNMLAFGQEILARRRVQTHVRAEQTHAAHSSRGRGTASRNAEVGHAAASPV